MLLRNWTEVHRTFTPPSIEEVKSLEGSSIDALNRIVHGFTTIEYRKGKRTKFVTLYGNQT